MIKTIVVDLSWPNAAARPLPAAVELAQRHGAELFGMSARRSRGGMDEQPFLALCKANGISGHWREIQEPRVPLLIRASWYADLVIVHQQPEFTLPMDDLPERLALAAACPILMIPEEGPINMAPERVLIGWKNSREAARTVREALPLLKAAAEVHLVTVDETADDAIFRLLDRHGIAARPKHIESGNLSVAQLLLSQAQDLGCGLIVMGAYGHWRVQELIFGGVTQELFRETSVPVFASH